MLGKWKDFEMHLAVSKNAAERFLNSRDDIEIIDIRMSATHDSMDVRQHSFLIIYKEPTT